jgi:hypothetical protein
MGRVGVEPTTLGLKRSLPCVGPTLILSKTQTTHRLKAVGWRARARLEPLKVACSG